TSGPVHGALVRGVDPYAKGKWINQFVSTAVTKSNPTGAPVTVFDGTQTGAYQWFNPAAFAPIWDSTSHQCFNPATGSESLLAADCQFSGSNSTFWRGPGFQWYNVFNHPNFTNPSISAPACFAPSFTSSTGKGVCNGGGSFSQLAGFGE